MNNLKIALLLLALCGCATAYVRLPRSFDDDDDDGFFSFFRKNDDEGDNDDNADDDDNDDDDYRTTTEAPQPLGIASIKSRAIAMDRGLCREQSRYHPHYPRCQEYCDKLSHWMGMCRRDSCHCYS